MKKKTESISKQRQLKNSQKFAEDSFQKLSDCNVLIEDLKSKLVLAELKNQQLEELLKESKNIPELERKSKEEEIIQIEMNRLHKKVYNDGESLDKYDLKKFDTLVKDLVALRGGNPKKKAKKDDFADKTTAELLRIVSTTDEQ